jgi:hypothetical protein
MTGGEKGRIDVSETPDGRLSFFIPPFVLARRDNVGLVVAVGLYFVFRPQLYFASSITLLTHLLDWSTR